MTTNEILYNIFTGTLVADKNTREAAELALTELSIQQPALVVQLIEFCCQSLPPEALSSPQNRNVLLAAAIRVRNVLGRSDWNRNAYFTPEVKAEVRARLAPLQCAAHVPELVRRQLLAATTEVIRYDYPKSWPELEPQITTIIDESVRQLNEAGSGGRPSPHDTAALLPLKGALGILRGCCKVYQDPLAVDAVAADGFGLRFVPSLVSLTQLLLTRWRDEAIRVQQQQQQQSEAASSSSSSASPMPVPVTGNVLEFTPLLTELSHCLRLTLKCCWSLMESRWPKSLCQEQAFLQFWTVCVEGPTSVMSTVLMPLCRRRIEQLRHRPSATSSAAELLFEGDHFGDFQESSVWRVMKWVETIAYKLTQEFVSPKSCEKRARAVAAVFSETILPAAAQTALELVRWHGEPVCLTSKAYIMALELLTAAIEHKKAYQSVLLPNAEELMTTLLFPRLAFSSEDAELWQFNPEEYVRKQSSPTGDLFSAKVVSTSLLLSLAVPSKKYHDGALLGSLVNFLMNQLQVYSPDAARATGEGAYDNPLAMTAARRVDAALFCLHHFKKVLLGMSFGDDKIEYVLTTFVVPATRYPLGFLRARAVLVLSVFAASIQWSSPQAYQTALSAVLPLLSDPEPPVQVQTCVSFSRLIRHPYAREVITPCIAELIQHYFQVMRLMDNEAVVRTLRKTIAFYHDSLSQWAVQLAEMVVDHFASVLRTVTGKYNALEQLNAGEPLATGDLLDDDGFADTLMAADELLETLTTLVRALPASSDEVVMQLQLCIAPMLFVLLSHQSGSTYGFMDPALMLLTTLLSRSPHVAPATWRLLPCLQQLVIHGAVDYFGQMLAPLDNFASVEPVAFMEAPLQSLCEVPPFAVEQLSTLTPAQIVTTMCDAVLQSPDLRNREVSSVPKTYDAVLQNYWAAVPDVDGDGGSGADTAAPRPPAASALVSYAARQMLVTAGTRPQQSNTLRVLLADTVFSCVLADPATAVGVLRSMQVLGSFFEQYVYLVSSDEMQSTLRSYDRNLFVLAFTYALRLLSRRGYVDDGEALQSALSSIAESQLLLQYAQRETVVASTELKSLRKRLQRMAAAAAAATTSGGALDGEDGESWADDEEGSDGEDDIGDSSSDGDFFPDEDSGEEEENGNDEAGDNDCGEWEEVAGEDPTASGSDPVHAMVQQAQALRKGRKQKAGGGGGDLDGFDDEDVEDNLLDEEDFSSPVDAVNGWAVLLDTVNSGTSSPSPSMQRVIGVLRDGRLQAQAAAIAQVKELMEQLFAVRQEVAGRLQSV